MNVFEIASRKKMRFASPKGPLTVEQLWDLPLGSKNGASLDEVGKAVIRSQRSLGEESLVERDVNAELKGDLAVALEIVKHIISVKQAENQAAVSRQAARLRREKLLRALESKDETAIASMSREEIEAELQSID